MINQFIVRSIGRACGEQLTKNTLQYYLAIQLSIDDASEIVELGRTLISLVNAYGPQVNALQCTKNTAASFFTTAPINNEAFFAIPMEQELPDGLPDLNIRMIISSSGVSWQAYNDNTYIQSSEIPFQVLEYISMGSNFSNETGTQIIQHCRNLYPSQQSKYGH